MPRFRLLAWAALALALAACGQTGSQTTTAAPTSLPVAAPSAAPGPAAPSAAPAYPAPTAAAPTSAAPPAPTPFQTTLVPVTSAPAAGCLPDDPALAPPANPAPPPAAPGREPAPGPIPTYGYRVVASYPHDRSAYTEGLNFVDGALYEGTGLTGQSELRLVELASGAVLRRCSLPAALFGKGVAVLGERIYQLTWQNGIGFVYDKASWRLLRSFRYPGEGWGLTHDGQRLIMSDGTATIRFLDPATLEQTGQIVVYDDAGPVTQINELEYVEGTIYANIWQTDRIAQIDPASGSVIGWIDLGGLLSGEDRSPPAEVLNGIAYDPAARRLFVTGKFWPKLFEIALVPRS